ncbi:MAG: bifunctional 4-hydroxy-3-methylbut-2-enyl diphosphate reductase/30S ribosomal protein S1 [Firmicutes bacterium]|nr:bifunctional 4-hydroxy-3-methylbut-2-enyl diphosphate reductase/30S ribosomal protein S1 [Bacillota bacterium]
MFFVAAGGQYYWQEGKDGLIVELADNAGFCFGVKRAIDAAMRTADEHHGVPIYTLGPLIHSPQTVAHLTERGIKVADRIEEIDTGVVIIRSHGVPPQTIERARAKGLRVVDATCPFVVRAMTWAAGLRRDGYQVVIVGDRDHPEVTAILGATDNTGVVAGNPEEVVALPIGECYGAVAQTTQSLSNYRACIAELVGKAREVKFYDSICTATARRQQAAHELASRVDVMLVVGGRNSANTSRLAQICQESGARTYHIETAEEIEPHWFRLGDKVGVTAGASTPNWLIEEVVQRMTEFEGMQEQEARKAQTATVTEEETTPETETEAAAEGPVEEVATEEVAEQGAAEATAEEETAEAVAKEEVTEDEASASTVEETDEDSAEMEAPTMAQYDETFITPSQGDIVSGKVVQVSSDEVLVHVGGKSEGRIPRHELGLKSDEDPTDKLAVGDEIDVYVVRIDDSEGSVVLSKRRADQAKAWQELEEINDKNELIEATVTERVKGGLLVDVGVRGFVPASHVARHYVEDLEAYVGKSLRLKIIELDKQRNNVVLSHKEVLEEEYEKQKEVIFNTYEPGDIVDGIVRRLTDFGAFVDIGSGVEGLLHVSEMAYSRVGHPSDILSEGQETKVMILNLDKETERISLGLKQTLPDPWDDVGSKYHEGDIVEGEVTRTVDFGAFVKLEDGVEGLVHISQLADRHVANTEEVVTSGELVKVKIISIDEEARRIGLSIKEAQREAKPKPTPVQETTFDSEREPEGSGVTIGDLVGDLGALFNNDDDEDEDEE